MVQAEGAQCRQCDGDAFSYLVAGVHVNAPSEAMIQAAVFQLVAVVGGHGLSDQLVSAVRATPFSKQRWAATARALESQAM